MTPDAVLTWTAVCPLAELEPFWGEAALVGQVQLAVFRLPGELVRVVGNEDPRTGSNVMSRGIVGSRADRATIASPLHKEVYDLETGECLSVDGPSLAVYPARIVEGIVEVGIIEAEFGTP